jgi:hypothetical protein
MSIQVKSTAVAIATASSVFSFSVPSQAGEYGYLYELETMVQQEGVNYYSDDLSVSEKLERGKEYCELLESTPIKKVIGFFILQVNNLSQEGYSNRQINDLITLDISILHASVKELCPAYGYKFNKIVEELKVQKTTTPKKAEQR